MTSRFALLLALLLPFAAFAAPPAAKAPAAAPLVEGRDYVQIPDGKPYAPLAGKIEVVEIFSYTCGHCAHFDPIVEKWKAKLPKDVRFTYLPLVYDEDDAFARGFFASQAMGTLAKTHSATFKATHDDHALPHNPTLDEVAGFYAGLGVDAGQLKATAAQPATGARLAHAMAFAQGSGLEGTPALIVNGRYLVRGRTYEDLLRIAGQLVARERAAGKRR